MVTARKPSRRDRIAARLIPWDKSPSNEGRKNRLRGGKRGRQCWEATQAFEVCIAIRELEAAHEMLVGSDHGQAMESFARSVNRREAFAKIALAWRALNVVIDREPPK